jgi:Protein of unknown function (DUF2384)
MDNSILETYYPGDEAWRKFSDCFDEEWQKCAFHDEVLLLVKGDLEIAKVVYGTFLKDYGQWLIKPIPALSGNTPVECLNSEDRKRWLKTILMRMPR